MQCASEQEKRAAVESYCTHICAQRPSLKINPSHCQKRREMAGRATSALETYHGWECLECPGPVPRLIKPEEGIVQAAPLKKSPTKTRYSCKVCGNTDVNCFYPSTRTLCKFHHNERYKERKRSHPGNIPLNEQDLSEAIKETESQSAPVNLIDKVMEAVAESPQSAFRYTCPIHGPHSGHQVGSHFSKKCKQCINDKRSSGIKSSGVFLRLEVYPWLRRWLADQAGCDVTDNRRIATVAMRRLAVLVPAEFIKTCLLEEHDA